jgi:3-hydroxy acid dehydrogenase/malonic semialdehyde reductase
VRDRLAVNAAVEGLPPAWRDIDILVNNAGLSRGLDRLQDGDHADWDEMIDTNVKGLLWVSRAVLPGMVARDRGHVINVGSIAGHQVYQGGNVYCATKFAVQALTRGLRLDLLGTMVRCTTVDPGMVQTEFSEVRFHGDRERADKVYRNFPPLQPADVAEAIVFCATRPPHVAVQELVLMPQDQGAVYASHPRGVPD